MGDGEENPDIEGLGSGLASAKHGGTAFDEEQIEVEPGVPTGDQSPGPGSADDTSVMESGWGADYRVPEEE